MSETIYWGTDSEIKFIDNIGNWNDFKGGEGKAWYLRMYLDTCCNRMRWGAMNSEIVIDYAKKQYKAVTGEDYVADDKGCGVGVRGEETQEVGQENVHSPQTEHRDTELETEDVVGEAFGG